MLNTIITIKNLLEQYLLLLSLPSGYKLMNIKQIFILIFFVITTIFYLSDSYQKLENILLKDLIVSLVMIYAIFTKFNIIIRSYNIFIKSIYYFYNNFNNSIINLNLIIFYYIYNITWLILSFIFISKLDIKLSDLDRIYDIYSIYSLLISGILGYLYIDYLSNLEIVLNKVTLNNIKLSFRIFLIFSLFLSIIFISYNIIYFLESTHFYGLKIFKSILNDGTNTNTQVNNNSQSNINSNNNLQNNNNTQINYCPLGDSSNSNIQVNSTDLNSEQSNQPQRNYNYQTNIGNTNSNTNPCTRQLLR